MYIPIFLLLLLSTTHAAPDLSSSDDGGPPPFSYHPGHSADPTHWHSLTPGYATCGTGHSQSPIDIPSIVHLGNQSTQPFLQHGFGTYTPHNSSVNFELSCETQTCATIFMGGVTYTLINIHFHSPSEHTRGGRHYPLEVHLVHSDPQGQLAVVSVLFEMGTFHQGVEQAMKGVREKKEAHVFTGLLVGRSGFCTYDGSLTTPPCSEGVKWVLTERVAQVAEWQVKEYSNYIGEQGHGDGFGNNRPLQKMFDRNVTCYMSHFY